MCGRSRVSLAPEQVLRAAGTARWVNREAYQPAFNCSPGAATPVVMQAADGVVVHTMRWGLVPSYTKKDERPDFWRMFNARSETIAEKPAFRRLVPSRRCLVLVNAFYEWLKQKDGTKQPYHIYLAPGQQQAAGAGGGSGSQGEQQAPSAGEEEPLVFAGLYDVWEGPDGPMHTYTILTTDACKRLEWLHDRMPVILRTKEAQQAWLSADATGLQKLFTPYNGEDLRWFPVTQQMNKPSFQGPECCKEVKKPSAQDFFKPRRPSSAASSGKAAGGAGSAAAAERGAAPEDVKAEPLSPAAAKQEQQAAPKQEQAPPAAAAVKDEAGVPAGPKEEQRQQAAEPAGPAAEAVNPDEQPAAKPSQQQQQQAAGASPAGQKRKQASGGGSKGGGTGAKKPKPGQKPPGQRDVRQFFLKQ